MGSKINKIFLLDAIFILLLFATPVLQWTFPWGIESNFSFNLNGVSFYYTELFYLLIIFKIFYLKKKNGKVKGIILILLSFGVFTSFISALGNNNPNWISNFFISLDFYFYGILFCLIKLKVNHLKIIRYVVLFYFFYVAAQQFLVPTGLIQIETSTSLKDAGGIYRIGTSIGSPIATGYFILMMSGILLLLFKNKTLKKTILITTFLVTLLTLSRGPILSFVLVIFIVYIKKVKTLFLSLKFYFFIFLLLFGLNSLNKKFSVLDIIELRFAAENVTSNRDSKWTETLDIYKKNSIALGAGNNLVPLQRALLSKAKAVEGKTSSPHNFFLSYLVETGLIGLVCILALMMYLFYQIFKTKNVDTYSKYTFLILFVTLINLELNLRNGVISFIFWFLFFLIKYNYDNSQNRLN